VAGGIPILSPLASDLAANTVSRVRGIVNGTTNFILTSMGEFGRSYDDVLAEAQANGYAEADRGATWATTPTMPPGPPRLR
jgi:homoserine dehydrogenase